MSGDKRFWIKIYLVLQQNKEIFLTQICKVTFSVYTKLSNDLKSVFTSNQLMISYLLKHYETKAYFHTVHFSVS